MAGFQVIMTGRFWVFTEDRTSMNLGSFGSGLLKTCTNSPSGMYSKVRPFDLQKMGYLLHSGRPYILWLTPSAMA